MAFGGEFDLLVFEIRKFYGHEESVLALGPLDLREKTEGERDILRCLRCHIYLSGKFSYINQYLIIITNAMNTLPHISTRRFSTALYLWTSMPRLGPKATEIKQQLSIPKGTP